MDVLFDAEFAGVPGGEWDIGFEVFYLEPILYVYCNHNRRSFLFFWFHMITIDEL